MTTIDANGVTRQSPGAPSGGQFAAATRAEADTALTAGPTFAEQRAELLRRREQFAADGGRGVDEAEEIDGAWQQLAQNAPDIEVVSGPAKLVLTYIGEGYGGDYDPDDPEDEPLYRLDSFYRGDESTGEDGWEEGPSWCTQIHTMVDPDKLHKWLDLWTGAIGNGIRRDPDNAMVTLRTMANKLGNSTAADIG